MKYGNVHFTHVTLGPSSLLGQHDISTGQNCFPEHNGVLRRALPGRATSWGQGAIHGIHGGGAGETNGAAVWVPDPPGHATPGCALENGSVSLRAASGWLFIARWWE
jgi:hypothetical protein